MKAFFSNLWTKIIISLLAGIGLLFLISRFADLPAALPVVFNHLSHPRGMFFAVLAGCAFLLAFSIRGTRWNLFVRPIKDVGVFKVIRLFLISIFINFLLPFSGGEIAKTLMLKKIANVPISRSLPTVAMDRSLDLLPAFFIMALVPILGLQMDFRLWFVVGTVGALFIALACFVVFASWKHGAALALLRKITTFFPKAVEENVEAFATNFVDSVLIIVRRPRIFIPAVVLTCTAVVLDSLFAMFAFWVVGFPIPFGTVLFGYTLFNLFFIFPTPPGQVGSNEAVGLLVFGGLLHLPAGDVIAMFLFSHTWAALLMCSSGMIGLKSLGLTISNTLKASAKGSDPEARTLPPLEQERADTLGTNLGASSLSDAWGVPQ